MVTPLGLIPDAIAIIRLASAMTSGSEAVGPWPDDAANVSRSEGFCKLSTEASGEANLSRVTFNARASAFIIRGRGLLVPFSHFQTVTAETPVKCASSRAVIPRSLRRERSFWAKICEGSVKDQLHVANGSNGRIRQSAKRSDFETYRLLTINAGPYASAARAMARPISG